MNRNNIESFTLKQLSQLVDIKNPTGLEDELIILGEHVPNTDILKYPCRIDSVVIFICLTGELVININLNEYHIQPRTMILNVPENIIQLKCLEECNFFGISISPSFFEKSHYIDTSEIISIYTLIREKPCLQLSEEENRTFCQFISLIQTISHLPDSPKRVATIQELGAALICYLYDTIIKYRLIEKPENKKSRQEIIFGKFISLLSQYHMSERSVTFYAEQLCITPKYFSTLVKKKTGKSATQWIDNYVILEAKNLLKYSELSIQEIAYKLNFSTQSFFGKYFKHQTGMSPTEYRNKV